MSGLFRDCVDSSEGLHMAGIAVKECSFISHT
jgi:hypothetical protein